MVIRYASAVITLAGLLALVSGLAFWFGAAPSLVSMHMLLGFLTVAGLWTIGIAQARSTGGSSILAALAVHRRCADDLHRHESSRHVSRRASLARPNQPLNSGYSMYWLGPYGCRASAPCGRALTPTIPLTASIVGIEFAEFLNRPAFQSISLLPKQILVAAAEHKQLRHALFLGATRRCAKAIHEPDLLAHRLPKRL